MSKNKDCSKKEFYGYRVVDVGEPIEGWVIEKQYDIVCSRYEKGSDGEYRKVEEDYREFLNAEFFVPKKIDDFLQLFQELSESLTDNPKQLIISKEIVDLVIFIVENS